jgi:hypothetical protein
MSSTEVASFPVHTSQASDFQVFLSYSTKQSLCERLREEVFWGEKDFDTLLDLIAKTEDLFGKIDKKKVTFTVK